MRRLDSQSTGRSVAVAYVTAAIWIFAHSSLLPPPAWSAEAGVEYRYESDFFDLFSCGGNVLCPIPDPEFTSYTTEDFVRISLILDEPLESNLELQDVRGFPGFGLTLSDGQQELSFANEVLISTDDDGNIVAPWSVIAFCCPFPNNGIASVNWPGVRGIVDQGVLSAPTGGFPDTPRDQAQVSDPRAWTRIIAQPDSGLFGVDLGGDQLITIDPATGTGTSVGPIGFSGFNSLAFDGNSLFTVENNTDQLLAIDRATGVGTPVGPLGFDVVTGLAFDATSSTLLGVDVVTDQLITIDPTTGAATAVGPLGFGSVNGLTFDPSSNTLFGVDLLTSQLITIDTAVGAGTVVGPIGFGGVVGLAFDLSTNTLYGVESLTDQLITIDPTTGAGTAVGPLGFVSVEGLTFASANSPPTAIAGDDQAARVGENVFLDGGESFDDNTASESLVYSWSFATLPTGSTATLINASTNMPSFFVDVVGSYEVELVVTDEGGLSSVPDSVIISSVNLAPTADAGPDQLVIVGSNVVLDGTNSSDPENDLLTFSWQFTTTPAGSVAALSDADTSQPSFVADIEGVYEISLVVSDSIGPSAPNSVSVVATSVEEFAEIQIVTANGDIVALAPEDVTTVGNQTALTNFLAQATVAIQANDLSEAINKLEKAIVRTDGCALRGTPDGNGPGRDWITDCASQQAVYDSLNSALAALIP